MVRVIKRGVEREQVSEPCQETRCFEEIVYSPINDVNLFGAACFIAVKNDLFGESFRTIKKDTQLNYFYIFSIRTNCVRFSLFL